MKAENEKMKAAAMQALSQMSDKLGSMDMDNLASLTITLTFDDDKDEEDKPEHPEPDEDDKGGPSDEDADNAKEEPK